MSNHLLDTRTEVSNQLHQWAELATFVARAFTREIDTDFLEETVRYYPQLTGWIMAECQQDILQGLEELKRFIHAGDVSNGRPGLLEDMAVEFAGLFYGAGPSPVNMIESVYLGDEHCLYEAPYFEVLEHYDRWGFEKSSSMMEPEDHLAVELDFVAYQICAAAWDAERGQMEYCALRMDDVNAFIEAHLAKWAPGACQAIVQTAESPFYVAAAYLTRGLLKEISRLDIYQNKS